MKQIYLTKKINEIVSTILILLGLKKESVGLSTTRTSSSLINFDSRNSFGLYSFKAALVFLFFVFGVTNTVQGQVGSYSFSTSTTGTLDPMTGSTQLVAASQDDTASALTNIGFSFVYNNAAVTQFSANANGLMRLGSTVVSTAFSNGTATSTSSWYNATTQTPLIAPYWDDLATGVGGKVHYLLTGTAPNRILKVEWFVTVPRNTTGTAASKFQVWLYETTNVIEIRYGSGMVANTTNSGASIGLCNATSGANNMISVTASGTTATSSLTTYNPLNTAAITSGLMLTFTPPPACVAPTAQATALTFGTSTSTSNTGSFTAASPAASGYLVVRSTSSSLSSGPVDGTTYAAAAALGGGTVVQSGSAVSFTDSSLTSNTQYYYFVYAYNSGTCTGGPKYFTTSPLSSSKVTCPAAPTAPVNSGQTTSGATVSWTAPTGSGAAINYTLEVYTNAGFTTAISGSPFSVGTPVTYTLSGLSPGTTYYYRIKANNGCDSAYLTGSVTTVAAVPTITSFTPSALCVQGGQTVTITGTNLAGATSVKFGVNPIDGTGGIAAASFVVVNSTTITAVVPVNVVDGVITVTNPAGTATSGSSATAAPTPTVGVSSGTTTCAGVASSLTATGASTYSWSPSTALSATTGDTVTASPTATTTYTVTGTSTAGCTATNTVTVTISPTPTAITVSKNPTSVCYGGITALTATGGQVSGPVTAVLGSGATTGSSYDALFYHLYGGLKDQFLVKASELTALGLTAGNITSLGFTMSTVTSMAYSNFAVNIAPTNLTAMTTTMVSSNLTQVYSATSFTPVTGLNTLTFSTPFVWDGTSNIVIQICWSNATTGGQSNYALLDATSFVSCAYYRVDSTAASTLCATTAATSTTSNRPKFTFGATGLTNSSVVWTNTTDLYSNSGATTAYAGENLRTVYSKNTNSQTYTVSATVGSCTTTGSTIVTPNPLPTITASNASICSGGAGASLTATGGATYSWAPSTGLSATTGTTVTATPSTTTTYTITGTDSNGCVNTGNVTVTVNTPVAIITQPANAVVLVGDPASFTVAATGTGLTYQWQENSGSGFADISGATAATYTISATTSGQTNNTYRCIVSGASPCTSVTSSAASLTVGSVSIASQPVAQTICSDSSATFSIVASGDVASYQWEYSTNGTSWTPLTVTGYDTNSITLSGLTAAANSGVYYHCVLNAGAVTSNAALLTVRDAVVIGTQPTNQSVCAGAPVTFTAAATGTGLTYQWQVSTNGTVWNNVSGATATTYTISAPTASLNNNQYRVIVTGTAPCSPVTSNAATLTVTDVAVAASASSICIGGSTTLSATFTGAPNYTTASWTSTAGSGAATAVSGTSATVTPTAAGTYVYTFASNGTCPFTKTVSVTVNALPIITSATATPTTVCSGATINLAAVSTSVASGSKTIGTQGTTSLTGGPYRGGSCTANKVQYLIPASELLASGMAAGNITSLTFVTTSTGSALPNFTISLGNTALTTLTTSFVTSGLTQVYSSASYTPVSGNNVHTFSTPYTWDGTSNIIVSVCHDYACSSSATMSLANTTYNGTVYLTSGTSGSNCTSTTGGTNTTTRPVMTLAGQVSANLASSYTWSWAPGTVTTATGTTSVTNTSGAALNQTFTATATNAAGCTNSLTTAAVKVNSTIPTPTASNSTQCGTGTPTCSVTGTGISGNTFKWYLTATGGTALSGQTASTLSSYPVSTVGDNLFYVSEVSADGLCESPRVTVTATVTAPFAFSLNGTTATNCSGSASLTPIGIATNGGYTSYSWSPATGVSGNETTGWTFSPTATTTYTVTATGGGCSATASVVVTPTALPIVTATASPASICVGASSTLTALTSVISSGDATVGTGATTIGTITTGEALSPFTQYYEGQHTQYLVLASDLTAAGLTAGNLTGLKLNVTSKNSTKPYTSYTIKLGATSLTSLTSGNNTSTFSTVYASSSTVGAGLSTVSGVNTFAFGTGAGTVSSFNWNGTSNLLVDICFANDPSSTGTYYSDTDVVAATTKSYTATYGYYADNSALCGTTGASTSSSTKLPDFTFTGQKSTSGVGTLVYTWNDPAASTGNTLTVSPSTTTTYTVSGYNSTTGCTGTATATVTLYTPPTAPSVTSTTQCGPGVPRVSVADTNGYSTPTFKWYADNTTTTALQTSTSTTYTSSVSVDTTFYVSVVSPGGCESPRTAVTTTIVTPATLTVSNAAAVCTGGSTTLTASGAVSYTWTPALGLNGTTGASVIATPSASTTYSVTGIDSNGCTTAAKTIAVTVNPYPSALTITQGATSVCTNSVMSLTATGGTIGGPAIATVGTDNATTKISTTAVPYRTGTTVGNAQRNQYLITAAELTAAGITAGNFNSVAFTVNSGGGGTMSNLTFNMANVSDSALTSTLLTPSFTNVLTLATYSPVVGTNSHTFTTPFNWNGTSNVLLQICGTLTVSGSGCTMATTNTAVTTTVATNSSTGCSDTTGTTISLARPVITFGYTNAVQTAITWSPSTDLYTNSGATTAYTGGNTNVVYTKPSGNVTYTATASNGACAVTATTNVTPTALPSFTLSSDVTICKGLSTSLVASGSGYTYVWSPATGLSATTGDTVSANPTVTTTYSVEATDTTTGCKSTKTVTVTVSEPGSILTTGTDTSQISVPTGSTTFHVATASGTTYTYQWQVSTDGGSSWSNLSNDTYYSNVNTATLSIDNIEATFDGYKYQCLVTGASPCATLTPIVATLTVTNTGIAQQPASVTLCGTSSTSFTIVTNGDDPYGIQWQMSTDNGANFTDIADGLDTATGLTFAGIDQLTLNVSGVTAANNNVKFLCVLNFYLPSNPATLTYKTPVAIATQPADQTVCVNGGTATFSVAATGSDLTYQWQYSTNGTSWSNYTGTGATTASISIVNPALAANGTQYKVIVSGNAACTSATSSVATLYINNPTITSQPVAATVLKGNTATYSVVASAATSYQWQRSTTLTGTYADVVDATPTGTTYSGATSATLSVITSGTTATGGGNYYRCVANNNGCTVASTGALLTVTDYCASAATNTGDEEIYNVTVNGSSTDTAYSYSNGCTVAAPGAGSVLSKYSNFTSLGRLTTVTRLQNVPFSIAEDECDGATYYSNGAAIWIDFNQDGDFLDAGEQVYSESTTTISPRTIAGSFAIPSTATLGTTRMRITVAEGYSGTTLTPCLSYGYGETEDYLIQIDAAPACSGTPVAGTATASSTSLCSGNATTVSLSGSTSGVTGISYQWYYSANGTSFAPVSGATTTSLATGTLTADAYYYCAVTCANSAITVNSNTVTITVANPLITGATPAGRCGTGTVTLGATANAGSTINWYAASTGGAPIASGTSFVTPSIATTTTYYAQATNGSNFSLGLASDTASNLSSLGGYGMYFATTNAITINSVDIYPSTAGTLTVSMKDASGTTVDSRVFTIVSGDISTTVKKTLSLGFNVPAGSTGWQLYYDLAIYRGGVGTYAYPSTSGGFSITGNTLDGNNLTSGTRYYFYNWNLQTGCTSARTAVTATVDPTPTATISYAGSPFCNNAATGSVTLTGTNAYTGGTFTSTSGLGLNGTTGAIDSTTSTPGTYTVTYTTNPTTYCTAQTATTSVVIYDSVLHSDFTYASASYCTNSASVTPTVTGTPGVFTVSPSGLTINATTGAINFATSTPGSYTVTNTVTACSNNSTSTFALTVYPAVTIGTQPASATVCAGANSSMTVAATGTSVVYQWQMSTNGTSWSNVSDGGVYSGSTSATLAITGATASMTGYQFRALVSDANPCGTVTSSAATLTVSQPTAPVITPTATNVCTGGTVALTVDGGSVTSYSNSFDALPSNFATSVVGTGTPTATLNTTYSAQGTGSVLFNTTSTSANVAYSMNTNLNLSGLTSAQLTFSHQALMEGPTTSYDYGYVEYSTNGGSTWTTFPTSSYAGSGTLFNSAVSFSTKSYADWITAFTSSTSTPSNTLWKTETINIPTAALTSQFRIRFRYTTDISTNYYGWLIDNVKVSTPNTVSWSPSTGLYTNAGATTAYTGGNVATVYAKPTASTSYTVTNTNGLGCTNSSTVAVTVLAPSTLGSITQPTITCSGAQTTFALTGLLANSTSTLSYTVNGGATQTVTGVVADASGNGSFTIALAGFTNGQTLAVTSIQRTDLTPSCSTTISANNTVVIAVRPLVTYYADADGDGFGNYSVPQITCQGQPSGYVTNSTDCNDSDATMNATYSFYADADGDGYGAGSAVSLCAVNATTPPAGYSVNNTDCNDADATKHASYTFYVDADADGFGTGSLVSVCAVNSTTPPTGYSSNNTDCNDSDVSINAHVTTTSAVTACGSYTWSVNGTSYTSSGTYTYEVDSCHTAVLNLTISCSSVVNLRLNIQGYYDASVHAMRPVLANEGVGSSATDVDVITVELHDATTADLVTSTTAMLQTDGTAVATFTPAISGSYYLVVKHRNSLETWSSSAQTVGATPLTYDFTSAANKAYGDNMIELESGVYGIYSGDLNQDGFIEGTDYDSLNSDTAASAIGYYNTDLNGDGFVDGLDYDYLNANVSNSVITSHP